MRDNPYVRFAYWMEKHKFLELQQILGKRSISMYETRKAICLPLSKNVEIGYVAPTAWNNFDICRRQLSWYKESRFSGQYLVISQKDISAFDFDLKPETIISKIMERVKIKEMPNTEAMYRLAEKEQFKSLCPDEFMNIDSVGDDIQSRWMKIMGIRGITYNELFISHCANHANFIEPEYFMETDEGPIPYSIGPTKQVCSACLEFFNLIGEKFKKKWVVPCPGAVLFAGMVVNQYYQVES